MCGVGGSQRVLISEQFLNVIGKADPSLQPVLETMYKLYAVSAIFYGVFFFHFSSFFLGGWGD